jgi:NhaP-type Na+/H+ or K+/H+ antiporter
MDTGLTFFFLIVIVYALIVSPLNHWLISMPIFFVVAGAFLGDAFPHFSDNLPGTRLFTELTLALLLFADASTLSYRKVTEDRELPNRLLLIGLLFSIAIGGAVAFVFFPENGIWAALLLGAILAPTDAALGLPIFSNPKVPVRIRRALNVESGLNDGIATPFVMLFLALALAQPGQSAKAFLGSALMEIGIAVVVAIVVGLVGGKLFALAEKRKWSPLSSQEMGALALALVAYSGSIALGGNGFIAAFGAGLLFGGAIKHAESIVQFTEIGGNVLSTFVWAMFGATVAAPLIQNFDIRALGFAILALTLIRMLSVAIALIGTGLRFDTIALMGWFGPRGLASVVFTLITLESMQDAGITRGTGSILAAASWTILLSVVLHGISAQPLANWYARRLNRAPQDIPERWDAPEVTLRRSHHIPPAKTSPQGEATR